jgi:hypothetical protein
MPANTTFTAGAVLTAQQMNNLPWGVVDATAGGTSGRGFVRSATNFVMTTTEADVTNMTVTFTPVAGRLYRATFNGTGDNVATAQFVQVSITDGSNVMQVRSDSYMQSTGQAPVIVSRVFSGLSGSTTLKVRARVSAANNAIINGFFNFTFTVEDIGPSA